MTKLDDTQNSVYKTFLYFHKTKKLDSSTSATLTLAVYINLDYY